MHACSGLWISCPNAGSIPKYWISHASTPEDLTSSVLSGNGRTLRVHIWEDPTSCILSDNSTSHVHIWEMHAYFDILMNASKIVTWVCLKY